MKNLQQIAIYGLSSGTRELLEQLNSRYMVAGLLDGYRESGALYGQKIISLEEAVQCGVEAIVVVARPSSRRIIVNRIQKTCTENGIRLYDVYGNDLLEAKRKGFVVPEETGISKEDLLKQIDKSDVVSFDIFDTLLTRKVLYPSDVFELVEAELVTKYGRDFEFSKERQEMERKLSREGVPTIEDIYRELGAQLELSEAELKEIRELEWQIEQKVLTPRREMCQVLQYALEKQKKVYLVSDMYYSEKQLVTLMERFGITGYQKLFVSCEYGMTKEQGLFRVVKEYAKGERYVHVGDSYVADVKSAEEYGIPGMWIKSGLELFEKMGAAALFEETETLADRIKQGLLVAELFNNPFVLGEGKIRIKTAEKFGYLIFAPLLSDFVLWLNRKITDIQSEAILFCARDGYLIQKLYDRLREKTGGGQQVKSVYFLTSRTSAVSAGMFQKKDIEAVAGLDFNGDWKEMLKARFLLQEEQLAQAVPEGECCSENIDFYMNAILDQSRMLRENYLSYVRTLRLPQKQVTIFDFVSSGTCQVYLERLLQCKMKGCYFMRVDADDPEKKQLDAASFYTAEERDAGKVYEDYFVLENIVTSPMPSIKCFDENGLPEYMEEKRSKEELEFVMAVQSGIVRYFEQYLELLPEGVAAVEDKRCSELIWSLIHEIPVEDEAFRQLVWEDSFYSRTLSVKDLM